MPEGKDRIRITKLGKKFGFSWALHGIDLRIGKGITLILGPNGAGKSTLLRCMAGLYKPDSGSVGVMGSDPYHNSDVRRKLSFMPDNYGLYDFLSVKDNIVFFARLYGIEDKEAIDTAWKTLKEMDAEKYLNYKVGALSRGTKQKILFCKALINDPEVILLDEPTAFLDAGSSEQVRSKLLDMAKEGKCVVFVTQRIDEATRFNSRVCVIKNGSIIKDTGTFGLYRQLFAGSPISIRLAKPLGKESALKLSEFDAKAGDNYIKANVNNYKDVNRVIKKLIDSGAYIASVDYVEPMIEKLYGNVNEK